MDWADEKAQEWLDKHDPDIWHHRYSLAALLREMRVPMPGAALDRESLLAEVERLRAEHLKSVEVLESYAAEGKRLRAALEKVLALHRHEEEYGDYCEHCSGPTLAPWPCPTVRILNGEEAC